MPVSLTLVPQVRGPLSVYVVDAFRSFGVDAFVTDRFGGVSDGPYDSLNLGVHVGDDLEHVRENRRRVARAADVPIDDLVMVHQVHGGEVHDVAATDRPDEGDALFCSTRALALAILVADCVPILVFDEASDDFCVIHAGWRGLDARVVGHAVERFEDPSTLHAFVGPSISMESYQVGPEVAGRFVDVPDAVVSDAGDRSRLDLARIASHQLLGLGVPDERVLVATQSTDGGGLFFSDRAQRPCGRFALVAKRWS